MKHPLVSSKCVVICGILLFLLSCRTITFDQNVTHTAIKTPVALGMIGLQEGTIFSSRFEVTTIPVLDQKVRVLPTVADFCRKTFKKYNKATPDNRQQVTYVDSLEQKPRFVKLAIIDKLAYKNALVTDNNKKVLTYLKMQKEAHVVTTVTVAFAQETIQMIQEADAVFLTNKKQKQYSLELIRDNQPFATLDFNKGTIFAYELSRFCWGVDKRNRAILWDVVDQNSSCPGNSSKDAIRAEERNATTYKL